MQCPSCGSMVNPKGQFCGHCGQRLTGVPSSSAPGTSLVGLVLVIERPGQPPLEVPLGPQPITIGRADTCDVVVDAPGISRIHAQITLDQGTYVLRDQGSTNGLYEHGRKVSEVLLRAGTRVRIPDPYGNMITFQVRPDTAAMSVAPQGAPAIQGTIALDAQKTQFVIGRDPSTDVQIDLPLVSRFHARLERQGNAMVLRDLRSTNGTYVNGQLVRGAQTLQIGDEIQIGAVRYVFHGTVLRQPSDQTLVRIDGRDLVRRVHHRGGQIILNDVSLSILPMEFVALIGGSGAGKTTLLHTLAGMAGPQSGTVYFNGQDLYHMTGPSRRLLGYVPQDDILHRELPVERALDYAARLRLPPDTTPAERKQRIDEVLADVRMEDHRAKPISKLSGGQRKRVSIALELLARPSVLFLDEPTSGLDPGLDKTVMGLLKLLSDKGQTVVLVTHATENIQQCDLVAMISAGRLVYYGPPADAPAQFGVTAFPDIYTYCDQHADQVAQEEQRFRQSPLYQTYVTGRLQHAPPAVAGTRPPRQTAKQLRSAAVRQWALLTQRYAELVRRDRLNLILLLAQAPVVGLLLVLVASSQAFMPSVRGSFIGSQQVLLLLMLAAIWFGTMNAAREIVKERPIYLRERMVNLRIWPYVLSKFAVLAVLSILQAIVLLAIVSFKTPHLFDRAILFPPQVELAVTLSLTSLAGLAMGLALSSLVTSADRAMSMVPVVLLAQVMFCGGIFSLSGVTDLLSRLFVSFWSLRLLGSTAALSTLTGGASSSKQMYTHADPGHLLLYWAVLAGWVVVFLAVTAGVLWRRDRPAG